MLPLIRDVLAGRVSAACLGSGGSSPPRALLSGSFNPLHQGHRELAAAAGAWLGAPVAYELSVVNADKPPLQADEVIRRASAFEGWADLWLTHAPTFREKARLFPGCVFVVGADTAERVVHPRYHGGSPEALAAALAEVRELGCRFLVAGRLGPTGYVLLDGLAIPEEARGLFEGLPESAFRRDISSTMLRGG